jgi:hypothetical protein
MTSVGATKATASPTRPVQGQRKRLLVGARGACRMATTSPTCVAASPQHAHGACCLPFLDVSSCHIGFYVSSNKKSRQNSKYLFKKDLYVSSDMLMFPPTR